MLPNVTPGHNCQTSYTSQKGEMTGGTAAVTHWYTPYCCVSEHPLGLHAQLNLATEKKHKCPCTKQKLEGEIDKHLKIYIRLSLAGCNTPLLLVSGSLS